MKLPPRLLYALAKARFLPQKVRVRLLTAAFVVLAANFIQNDKVRSLTQELAVAGALFALERHQKGQEESRVFKRRRDENGNELRHPTLRLTAEQSEEIRAHLERRKDDE